LHLNENNLADFKNLPQLIGVSVYAFEGITLFILIIFKKLILNKNKKKAVSLLFIIRDSMKEPEYFWKIFSFVNLAVCLLYVIFSVLGSLSLGQVFFCKKFINKRIWKKLFSFQCLITSM
jgi:hypothetical protein